MKRSVAALAAVLSAAALLGSCTINRPDSSGTASSQSGVDQRVEVKPAEQLAPLISVDDGVHEFSPTAPVSVKALDGTLTKVTMTNENGKVVEGKLSDDSKTWTNSEVLGFYRTYTIKAEGSNGTTSTSTFSTATPVGTTATSISPISGAEVGVGQTIAVRFGVPVSDRQAAQKAIEIKTTPHVDGAFYWLNDYEVRWRPATYWPDGTQVSVKANIYGAHLGGGVYGNEDNETNFTVRAGYHAIVDDNTKTMTIYSGDNVVKTMPISMGSNRWPTPNGIYMIGDRNPEMVMDSETFGLAHDKGGYKTKVQWATQMSYSGIYVHSAPWSVWAQGSQNVSHGCINVSPENARWFQENFKRGDIVEVRNSIGEQLSGFDGLGDWQIPWDVWSKGNA